MVIYFFCILPYYFQLTYLRTINQDFYPIFLGRPYSRAAAVAVLRR